MKEEQKAENKVETLTGKPLRKRRSRVYETKVKAQAVLSLWSGRRSVAALMRELEVPWTLLNSWERRALSGMLTALDPTWKRPEEGQPSLPRRLEKLIEQTLNPPAATPPATN